MAIPIPQRPSGAYFGNRAAPAQLEMFVDIQCPFSASAWPQVRALMNHYGEEKIGISINFFVLANHRQSFDITRTMTAVGQDDKTYIEFADFLYQNQERFFNGKFADKTHNDLIALCGDLANEFNQTDRDELAKVMESDENFARVKTPFRYAALRGVWATPTFFLNAGEVTTHGSRSTIDEWKELLDPFVGA